MLERKDLRAIFEIIKPNSKVLDLGCGDGLLLKELVLKKKINGLGIEISIERIKSCLNSGISVIQEDLNESLKEFKDNTFDFIVLSQTLEYVADPVYLIQEMLRVGKKVVISFENLAYWKNRVTFLLNGATKISGILLFQKSTRFSCLISSIVFGYNGAVSIKSFSSCVILGL